MYITKQDPNPQERLQAFFLTAVGSDDFKAVEAIVSNVVNLATQGVNVVLKLNQHHPMKAPIGRAFEAHKESRHSLKLV